MKKIDVPKVFGSSRALELQIDEFLDKVAQAAIAFQEGMAAHKKHGASDDRVQDKLEQLTDLEQNGNELRRRIEQELYAQMLLPDSRGDVIQLLEQVDGVLDAMQGRLEAATIERPEGPKQVGRDYQELVSAAIHCVSAMVSAVRAYFRDVNAARDHITKIKYYEAESDKLAVGLKKAIFGSDLPLEQKLHLRDYVDSVDALADKAEAVGDLLSVLIIKRSL